MYLKGWPDSEDQFLSEQNLWNCVYTIAEFLRSILSIEPCEYPMMKRVIESTKALWNICYSAAVSAASTAALGTGNADFECIHIFVDDVVDSNFDILGKNFRCYHPQVSQDLSFVPWIRFLKFLFLDLLFFSNYNHSSNPWNIIFELYFLLRWGNVTGLLCSDFVIDFRSIMHLGSFFFCSFIGFTLVSTKYLLYPVSIISCLFCYVSDLDFMC